MINSAERKKINFFRKEAVFKFRKKSPHLFYKLAGIALSNGGSSKIIEFLDGSFLNFMKPQKKYPLNSALRLQGTNFLKLKQKLYIICF